MNDITIEALRLAAWVFAVIHDLTWRDVAAAFTTGVFTLLIVLVLGLAIVEARNHG